MELSDEKWVRILADFAAEGVWRRDGSAAVAEDLPVSQELLNRLLAWSDWFNNDCEDYLPIEDRTTAFPIPEFAAEGLAIARAIKAELPTWTIVYFDESRLRLGDRSQPRREFEYEILLDNRE